ncbi:glutamic acid-rich protein isoform X2 [Drosophila novamexicana]|uniref:glutamic acid-rich protein isoform X2 n=1 Tax=Drosophila novamexicana TaxID=47314 RepID=UPI0011E594EB|nr:glutamic acid-rich protein isoform X2 [Drosophila novamexicana]
METKKIKTVINAEEEHLASKSIKTTRKTLKKVIKTNSKTEILVETKLEDTGSTNSIRENDRKTVDSVVGAPVEPQELSGKNAGGDGDGNGNVVLKKKSKAKKPKKCEYDNQNISVKSSFNKFDALQKRNLIHNLQDEQQTHCRHCTKPVYKMEEVIVQFKTGKDIYHKSCLRCQDCAKQLKFDNYQSHEGNLYCNVHFKLLFAPKVIEQDEEPKPRKTELIIRESQPTELPPDVVRASDKPDLGLDELHQLNVRSRFELFENVEQNKLKEEQLKAQQRPVIKRSTSVLTKYRLNSAEIENNGSDSGDESGEENEDADLIRSKRSTQKERPVGLGDAMNDIKTRFEKGTMQSKEERREERKQEIQNIRSRLFMGKQAKIKEMYQQAVAESEHGITSVGKQPDIQIEGAAARSIKERFENGAIFNDKGNNVEPSNCNNHRSGLSEDADVFESAISKKSRSIFKELEANSVSNSNSQREFQKHRPVALSKCTSQSQVTSENADINVVKCDAKPEDVKIATDELSQKFKFFETYRPKGSEKRQFRITPPREGVVKMPSPDSDSGQADDPRQNLSFDENVLQKTQTTSTMLSKFREMEQNTSKKAECYSPKPLKCFTPPPEDRRAYYNKSNSEEEEDEDEEEDSDDEAEIDKEILALSSSNGDEALKEAQSAARAKQLLAKFEKWQANEIKRELIDGYVDIYSQQVSDDSTIESAKAIRERFENMRNLERNSSIGPRYQVNRFV